MKYYDPFDCKINCEEVFSSEVDEVEYEEVRRLMAEESEGLQGFAEWLDSLEPTERRAVLEQRAFESRIERQSTRQSPHGEILIKRDCSHPECANHSWCKHEVRCGGITI